ncbi:MAG: hypothetical protein AAF633_20060, partial [Chloroflexota bacterium]
LVVDDGIPQFIDSPVEIEVFFDFDPELGMIAYGSGFWESASNSGDGVTDLTIYRFEDDSTTTLIEGDIGRAIWLEGRETLAAAYHSGTGFDLAIIALNGGLEIVAEGIDPYFAYSNDTEMLAYVSDGVLNYYQFKEEVALGTETKGIYQGGGWVGDAPLFVTAQEQTAIAVADDPFLFVPIIPIIPIEGAGAEQAPFVPTYLDQSPLVEARPLKMLWSSALNQLIVQEDNIEQTVRIYLLSNDLQFVTDSYTLDQHELVDWFIYEEQILLLDIENQPVVWDLE